jgi:hypothetical protein
MTFGNPYVEKTGSYIEDGTKGSGILGVTIKPTQFIISIGQKHNRQNMQRPGEGTYS